MFFSRLLNSSLFCSSSIASFFEPFFFWFDDDCDLLSLRFLVNVLFLVTFFELVRTSSLLLSALVSDSVMQKV